jgi:peptidyl-tRNA hydrolase, PTH1 family
MKVIIGLGNPGRRYEQTRHNVGWWVLDHLADVWRIDGWRNDDDSTVAETRIGDTRVRLVKPQTFMNLSGAALRPYLRRFGWSAAKDLLVIVDEVALPLGTYRLRSRGSAGGHNGLKSIEAALGNQDYARLRIGIQPTDANRQVGDLSDFVLDRFGAEEKAIVMDLMPKLADAVDIWLAEGIEKAMNLHNRKEG